MGRSTSDIYDMLQEIAWHFGGRGVNGECCGDLTFVEYMAIKKAHEKSEMTVQEIGNAMDFTKSGATRIVNRLEEKGYVVRERSPADGRVCCIVLTDKGKEAMKDISLKYTNYLEDVLQEVDPRKIEDIKDSLRILVKAVQAKESIQ